MAADWFPGVSALAADKACASKANRARPRRRRITAVIPEKTHQQAPLATSGAPSRNRRQRTNDLPGDLNREVPESRPRGAVLR